MSFQLLKLPNVTGNGANGTLTIECPIGYKYRNISLTLTSGTCTAAMVTQAQVLINGTAAWDITGTDLDNLNQLDGLTAYGTSSVLNFPFVFNKLTDDVLADLTALNTGVKSPQTGKVIHTLQVRLTIVGATAPNFEASAVVENSTSEGPGLIRRIHRYSVASVVGESGYNTLDYGTSQDALIRRFSIANASGTVSRVRLMAASEEVVNMPTATLTSVLQQGGYTAPAAFGAVADFAALGRGFLPGQMPYLDTTGIASKSMTLYVTNSAATGNVILMDDLGEV